MLAQFARQYSDCHIVVTCRIAAVDYTFEPAFTYLEMADFAPDQVEAFVRAWFWDEHDKDKGVALAKGMLTEWAKPEHAGIRDLGRNPLLLTLLCLNYAETQSFPARRVEIYEEALDALLKKWDASRQIKRGSLYKTLSLGRKRQMFARIAFDALGRNEIVFAQADLERRLVDTWPTCRSCQRPSTSTGRPCCGRSSPSTASSPSRPIASFPSLISPFRSTMQPATLPKHGFRRTGHAA